MTSNYLAIKTFTLQGITVAEGQQLPGSWPANLIGRIVAHGLARPMPVVEVMPVPPVEVLSAYVPEIDTSDMAGIAVVSLSAYPDIFAPLRDQMNYWEPKVRKILVTSGKYRFDAPGWEVLPGIEPFCFGRNANVGIRAAGANDVLLVNDDVRLSGPILRPLKTVAYNYPQIGILAPQVNGGCGNLTQRAGATIRGEVAYPEQDLAFIAVYIKHSTIARIGLFDERFTGYGCEDTDLCYRVKRAGLKSAVTSVATVLHGHNGTPSSCSFLRQMKPKEQAASMMEMRARLSEKWKGAK